ncbi:hypothetical protein ACJX0J_033189, partial [Zea mays]
YDCYNSTNDRLICSFKFLWLYHFYTEKLKKNIKIKVRFSLVQAFSAANLIANTVKGIPHGYRTAETVIMRLGIQYSTLIA